MGAKIEVFDSSGKKLLTGKTDKKGRFSFPRPKVPGDLKIVLSASMGHKGEFVLAASEMGAAATPARPNPDASAPKAEASTPGANVDPAALEAALDRLLEKRLAPLYKMVADLKKRGTSPTEVAGGIGYIVGILGLFAYFKSRGPKGGGSG
jgi:nickel transport protein